MDPTTGRVVPRAKPTKPGTTLEPNWEGEVYDTVGATTGKVLFTLGSANYVCSANPKAVEDHARGRPRPNHATGSLARLAAPGRR